MNKLYLDLFSLDCMSLRISNIQLLQPVTAAEMLQLCQQIDYVSYSKNEDIKALSCEPQLMR